MSSNSGRRGSVKQAPNGTWLYVLDLPSTELDQRGRPKRRQTRRRGFKTRREAQAKLTEALNSVATQTYVAPKRQTLGTFVTQVWLPAIRGTVKQSTYESYERVARLHTAERPIGMKQLQTIDGSDLNAHYLVLTEGDSTHAPLGRKTVRYSATVLHRVFRDAVRWRYLQINPVEQSDPPTPGHRPEMKTWSAVELRTFLEVAGEHRMMGAFWLLATTGMRRGEALGLKWADIDLDAGTARIRRALLDQNTSPGWRFESTKTAKGTRTVALDATCVAALRVHRSRQLEERMALGEGWTDLDLVNPALAGQPMRPRRLTEMFTRLCARHGLQHIRLHDLRHTHATLALAAGIPARVVQERLGHSTVSVTLDIYSHVDISMQADAAAKVAALVQGDQS